MARRCGCATSRFTLYPRVKEAAYAALLCFCLFGSAAEAGLYTSSDQIVVLSPENVESVVVNSTAATVVQFYLSWCGHCIDFSPFYKSLARDIREWQPAVQLAAVDCSAMENMEICTKYGLKAYPVIMFFPAYSKAGTVGSIDKGLPRDVQGLRHMVIDKLEAHPDPWPPACPPLEPISQTEVDSFFETNKVQNLALIFENPDSYIGREVTLDLLQFDNIAVRRVLSTEEALVNKLGVTEFPSCYLYYPSGNFTRLIVNYEARTFYSYALQGLKGMVRSGKPPVVNVSVTTGSSEKPWKSFNRSSVYMADLEAALHYSLRVEVAAHTVIKGDEMISLKNYVNALAKYFQGRPMVVNLLKNLNSWLQNQTGDEISYEAFKEILDNSAQSPDSALPESERWVGCQGSQPYFRGYPCGVWTLFHVLTVQANNANGSDPQEVLRAMRGYVRRFFGCRYCADHFEHMAEESMSEVGTLSSAVLWLWFSHNSVNNRIAGSMSEDPEFPKIQWPSPETCPSCHGVSRSGDHKWNMDQVLSFLMFHFSSDRILTDYLDDESHVLRKQRKKQVDRRAREAPDLAMPSLPLQSTVPGEEEEDEPQDEEEEGAQEAVAADEMGGGRSEPNSWAEPKMVVGQRKQLIHRKPRMRDMQEDIVDLDSFVNNHYKAKALQLASGSRVKRRTLKRKEEQEPGPVFGLGIELDTRLGMVALEPMEADNDLDLGQKRHWLQKRELTGQYFDVEPSHRGRWMFMLSIGFSKLDISLCVILYFLSTMCLLAMYLFFKNRYKLRRAKLTLP
ncbi:sulfhydryl oxidase 1 [Solea solea]|uniref:sulfhydryl oxidase 1 n=1 Tax=Solea solea TaxID=90069 RepID=UPI00272D58EB|nr:sulfhydryl oxidase 1 [Solea solea]